MNDDFVRLPGVIPIGALDPPSPDEGITFESLRAFLERKLPPAQALVGVVRGGTNLLPRFGWVMPWGREGSGKTSIVVDLLFHAAAGIAWIGYPIERPLRIVAIVNEGIPGGFQDKLRQKIDQWPYENDAVLDNLAVYVSPWGEFTFRDPAMCAHAHDFAHDFGADYVALDPLHTFGTTGAGAPAETEEFKHLLRHFGLWESIGILTAHHSNKLGMVSGDWARHPDTVLHVEKDGKNPATKLTLEKARPAAPDELGAPVLLEWDVETFGYERRALERPERIADDEVRAAVLAYVAAGELPSLRDVRDNVKGGAKRVGEVVKRLLSDNELINESRVPNRFALRLKSGSGGSEPLFFEDAPENGSGASEPLRREGAGNRMVDTKKRFRTTSEPPEPRTQGEWFGSPEPPLGGEGVRTEPIPRPEPNRDDLPDWLR